MPTRPPTHKTTTDRPKHVVHTAQQANARRLRGKHRWHRLRELAMDRWPICRHPECDGRTPAQEVHHIKAVETHPEMAYVMENLAPLCKRHHGRVTAQEAQGVDTAGLFQ